MPESNHSAAESPKAFRDLLAELITLRGFDVPASDELRLDLLGHIVDRYKHELHHTPGRITFDKFLQCRLFIDNERIVVQAPEMFGKVGSGIAPIQYQAPLLNFLLAHHQGRFRVIDILGEFIDRIWDQLQPLDFKRTQTGVTRCYTNTRFAAHTLRGYGFLKFTDREAFKTWELSLPGFVVAAQMSRERALDASPWQIKPCPKVGNFDLAEDIRNAWEKIESYDDLVQSLTSICGPDAEIFDTFEDVLKKAHKLLGKYWANLGDGEQTQVRRRALSRKIIHELEASGVNEEFYKQLSSCICINDELDRATLRASRPPEPPAQGSLFRS